MTYDTMSVDALLAEYAHAQWVGFYTGVESEISIKVALRKACIREASVGVGYVARDGTDGCPEFRFRCAESLTAVSSSNVCQLCRGLIPERQYVLIPSNLISKETP